MTYPHVTQFEARAFEAEAQASLTRERLAARAPERPTVRRHPFWGSLSGHRPAPGNGEPAACSTPPRMTPC